jgi:hypothetical protein
LSMREWNLKAGDPLSLTLAADARLSKTNYCDDQIWELSLGEGEPPGVALQTTFGLRARSFRIFPQFTEKDIVRIDQSLFNITPTIRQFAPNFLFLTFSPFTEIDVRLEYWIPDSQAAACRMTIKNLSQTPRSLRIEWIGLLLPSEKGERMAARELNGVPVLIGNTGTIYPLIFMTGGPKLGVGPFPSLYLDLDINPDEKLKFVWAHAALLNPEDSLVKSQKIAASNWESELTRIDIINSGLVEVYTGDPDWDAAFSLAQKTAYGLFHSATGTLPNPSFVQTRQTTHGFSLRGDGLDYSHLWNGQTPFDTYYLAGQLLPASPDLVRGLLDNFLSAINDEGFVDWKPSPVGQRSNIMATPLLASLALRLYEIDQDLSYLKKNFPLLDAFISSWFEAGNDRDKDGIPEWSHPMQTGYEDNPLFSSWTAHGQGLNINTAETPSLCAFLYRECQSLVRIGSLLDNKEEVEKWEQHSSLLRSAVEISWDDKKYIYRYWDRDSHFSPSSELLAIKRGSGLININRNFDQPVRLIIEVETRGERLQRPSVSIHGIGPNRQHLVEKFNPESFHWYVGIGKTTSSRVYHQLEFLLIEGLEIEDRISIKTTGLDWQDHTLLLPLWAMIPAEERARELIENTIVSPDKFWRPYGIPSLIGSGAVEIITEKDYVYIPWNNLVGEGLLNYGFRKEAGVLITKLMNAVIKNLKRERCFRNIHHGETGGGLGEQNSVEGLAPLSLFLDTLGVKIISPKCVGLAGINPFPWPVTVKYRGLSVMRHAKKTIVIFPDGTTATVTDTSPCIVSLD